LCSVELIFPQNSLFFLFLYFGFSSNKFSFLIRCQSPRWKLDTSAEATPWRAAGNLAQDATDAFSWTPFTHTRRG